jgi:hypothetical protein
LLKGTKDLKTGKSETQTAETDLCHQKMCRYGDEYFEGERLTANSYQALLHQYTLNRISANIPD